MDSTNPKPGTLWPTTGVPNRIGCVTFFYRRYTQGRSGVGIVYHAKKVRELVADLLANGFAEVVGGGKGSHRKFVHDRFLGALTLSGQAGDDAKPYQEKQVRKALEEIHEDD